MNEAQRGVPAGVSGAVRSFAGWLVRGSVGYPIMDGIDYWPVIFDHPSLAEEVFAVFANNLQLDANEEPVNFRYAARRAAYHLYYFCEGHLPEGVPSLEEWELRLY